MEKLTKTEFIKKCLDYRAEKARKRQKIMDDYFYERAKKERARKSKKRG